MENRSNSYVSMENQIHLINSVIKSTADLIAVMTHTSFMNKPVMDIISLIFKFLDQLMILLPDVLMTNGEAKNPKAELKDKFETVLVSWGNYFVSPTEFYNCWIDFLAAWSKYNVAVFEVTRSQETIFLSLN